MIELDADQKTPLYEQLYAALADEIRTGQRAPGTPLPGRRTMAAQQGVSVNTVDAAYQMLAAEGLAEPRPRSGFYVQKTYGMLHSRARRAPAAPAPQPPAAPQPPSPGGRRTAGPSPPAAAARSPAVLPSLSVLPWYTSLSLGDIAYYISQSITEIIHDLFHCSLYIGNLSCYDQCSCKSVCKSKIYITALHSNIRCDHSRLGRCHVHDTNCR